MTREVRGLPRSAMLHHKPKNGESLWLEATPGPFGRHGGNPRDSRTTDSSLFTSSVRACSAIWPVYLPCSCFASPSIDVNACCRPAASIVRPPA